MAWVNILKRHGEDRQAIAEQRTLPAGEGCNPRKDAKGRAAQIGGFLGDQLRRSARKALAKRPSRRMVASALVAMCSWTAPALAQSITPTITVKITDQTGITTTGTGATQLFVNGGTSGATGYQLTPTPASNSFDATPITPGASTNYQWQPIPVNGSVTLNLPTGINGFIFQVAPQSATLDLPAFSGSALVGGYSMLGEITTATGKNTFDTSNVDQFSIPARWTCTTPASAPCQITLGGKTINSLPVGNPLNTDTSPPNAPAYKLSRELILSDFKTSHGSTAYGKLLVADPSKFRTYQYLLNPTNATTINAGKSYGINPNTNFLGGIKTAWDDLTTKSFIISGAAGGVAKTNNIPFQNYQATPATSITPGQLGLNGGVATNKGTSANVNYGPSINPGSVATNATITGFMFTQCSQQNSTSTGCTTPGPKPISNFVLANPYTIARQIIQKNVGSTGLETGVVHPSTALANKQNGVDSGYVYVTTQDASKLQAGMFLSNGNAAGAIWQTDNDPNTLYGAYSQVYISSLTSDKNNRIKVNLSSVYNPNDPSGRANSGYIAGSGATTNNNTIVFSNTNVQALATSPQNQIFGNAGVFAINNNDIIAVCPQGTSFKIGCDQSTIVGNVRNQIVTALNRGSAVAPAAPLFNGTVPSTALPVNTVWGDPNAWYTQKDVTDNPEYNVYAAYLHNSGTSLEAGSIGTLTSFFGSAYAFGFDENPIFNGPTIPLASQVQVPSKIDSSIPDGATIVLTLTPWGPSQPDCGTNIYCWKGSSGSWNTATSWKDNNVPTTNSIVQFKLPDASSTGGIVNVDAPAPSIQALEFLNGVGSFTFKGNALTLTGTADAYAIRNESETDQTFNNPLNLSSNQPLAIDVRNGSGNSRVVLNNDLSGSGGWIKTGDGTLEINGVQTTQTGPINISEGTLHLNNSDLSKSSSIIAAYNSTIEGIGKLPGTGAGSIQGVISPGGASTPFGKLTFTGNLAIGAEGIAAFTDISEIPDQSDRIEVNGNLSVSSNQTFIAATAPDDIQKGDSYTLLKYSGSRIQSTGFGKFASELLSPGTKIVYDDISKTIRLEVAGDPSPTGCIKKGSPEDITDSVYTSICGGQLIVNQSGIDSQNWSLYANPFGQINRINAFGNTTAFTGVISDAVPGIPGNITFDNTAPDPSTIILTNANTYTGSTTVRNNVNLAVNGSIASSSGLSVESGGTVSGNGFLPATNLNPGATIAPGNSIGTLTAAALSLNGGTINSEIQGPQNDRINVTGNVTNFTGTANIIPYGGGSPFPGFVYTIISAPNSVDFAAASSLTLVQPQLTSALLNAGTTLVQNPQGDPKSFAVQWKPNNSTGAVSSAMQALGNGGANASCIAGSLDRAFNALATKASGNANNTGSLIGTTGFTTGQVAAAGMSTGFFDALNNLVQLPSNGQLVAAVNSLSPQSYAAFQSVGLDTLKQQREALLAQAGQCLSNGWIINGTKAKKPLCAFGLAQNNTSSIRGTSDLSSYNSGVFSGGIGLEYYPSKQWSFGGSYSNGTSYANNFSSSGATVTAGVNSINLFGTFAASDQWRVRGLLGYSNFNINGSRSIAFIGNGSLLSANTNANGFTAAIETDYTIPITKPSAQTQAVIKPLLGFAWGGYQQSGFSESGGPLSLSVASNTAHSFVTTAGLELSTSPIPLNKDKTVSIRPNLLIAYQVDALANNASSKSLNSTFAEASSVCSTCSTQGQSLGTSALNVAGGVDLQVSQSTSLYLNASYRAYSNASQFGYGGGIRVRF